MVWSFISAVCVTVTPPRESAQVHRRCEHQARATESGSQPRPPGAASTTRAGGAEPAYLDHQGGAASTTGASKRRDRRAAAARKHRKRRERPLMARHGLGGGSGYDCITWAQPTRWAKTVATIVAILPILGGMEPHFHAWLRSGRIFTMVTRPFTDRTTAHRWAAKQRPGKADRLVLACTECPPTRPSKRRAPRWATVARQVAAAVGAEPAAVRRALATALAAERERS